MSSVHASGRQPKLAMHDLEGTFIRAVAAPMIDFSAKSNKLINGCFFAQTGEGDKTPAVSMMVWVHDEVVFIDLLYRTIVLPSDMPCTQQTCLWLNVEIIDVIAWIVAHTPGTNSSVG